MKSEKIITDKGEFLFIEVPSLCNLFIVDMGYLIFNVPAYENWVTDEELLNPIKLNRYLNRVEGKEDFKRSAIKLPDADLIFMAVTSSFLADTHPSSQNLTEEIASKIVGDNGMGCYDNYRLKKDEKYTCTSAMQSFACLLSTSKLALDKTYAILKFD